MLANSGTSWMWFNPGTLVLANLALGVAEGVAIAAVWRVPFARSVACMVAANVISCLAGAALLAVAGLADITIVNVHAWLLAGLGATFVLALLVELPFVHSALAVVPRAKVWRRAAVATASVHAISYPLLLWLAGDTSHVRLFTDWSVVPVEKLAQPGTHVVFYVDPNGAQVRRRDLVAGGDVVVGTWEASPGDGPLFLQSQPDGSSSLHVWRQGEHSAMVLAGLHGLEVAARERTRTEARLAAPSLAPESPWQFQSYAHVLRCVGEGQQRMLVTRTPLVTWWPSDVTHIAGDLVLVALSDQICLAKASTGEIALVARGRWPTIAAVRR